MAMMKEIGDDPSVGAVFATKKAKKGFSVGPDNLPDGTHRRKGLLR